MTGAARTSVIIKTSKRDEERTRNKQLPHKKGKAKMKQTIHKSAHQEYIDAICEHFGCDLQKAVILALCIGFHNKGYDVKNNPSIRNALLSNGIDGNLWLFDEMFEENPNLFVSVAK